MPAYTVIVRSDRQLRWRVECPALSLATRTARPEDVPSVARNLIRTRLGADAARTELVVLVQGDDPRTADVVEDLAHRWSREVSAVRIRPSHELPRSVTAEVLGLPTAMSIAPVATEQALREALLAARRAERRVDLDVEEIQALRERASDLWTQLTPRRRAAAERAVARQLRAEEKHLDPARRLARAAHPSNAAPRPRLLLAPIG